MAAFSQKLLISIGIFAVLGFSVFFLIIKPNLQKNGKFDFTNALSMEEVSGQKFTPVAQQSLLKHGILVRPIRQSFYQIDPEAFANRQDDWTYLYQEIGGRDICQRGGGNAVYITSDANLHFYHRLFSMELEYLEISQFLPLLTDIVTELYQAALAQSLLTSSSEQQASYQRLVNYLTIPMAILDSVDQEKEGYSNTPQGFYQLLDEKKVEENFKKLTAQYSAENANIVDQEIMKVLAASEVNNSLITQQLHDYTQYQPRGHYNNHSLGQAYFIAMMWLGRNNFALNHDDINLNRLQTYDALNLVSLLSNSEQLVNWQKLTKPIDYLVGNNDDLSVNDYLTFAQKAYSLEEIDSIISQLKQLPKPQIMSAVILDANISDKSKSAVQESTQAFTLFSQRFTPDAYIFTNLTQGDEAPDPITGEKLPSTPTALMVPATFEQEYAQTQLDNWINENASQSKKVINQELNKLKAEFNSWNQEKWQSNHYLSWLYTLNSLNQGQKPKLVNNQAWQAKNLNTYLGSYAQLKHDTILYAKQSYAEMGGGGDDCDLPAVPYGYIEPNTIFFQRLADMIGSNRRYLTESQLLTEEDPFIWRLDSYHDALKLYQEILQAQLVEDKLTPEKYEELRVSFGNLDGILRPIFDLESREKNARSAIVTDIATDVITSSVLYQGLGIPDEIIMAIDDHHGRRLVRGLTYSYREFTQPLAQRLTDQTWQTQVYQENAQLPAQPDWWKPYFGE